MSKVTVITDAHGKVTAMGLGHLSHATTGKGAKAQVQGGLSAGPGQKLHEIELAEDVSKIASFDDLHAKVRPHLK